METCLPQVRAHVEGQLNMVARGQAPKGAVVAHMLYEFAQKFAFFVQQARDALFQSCRRDAAVCFCILCLDPVCGSCRRLTLRTAGACSPVPHPPR